MLETDSISFKISGLDGVAKTYHLQPVMRREACYVFNTFIRSAVAAVGKGLGAASLLSADSAGDAEIDSVAGPLSDAFATIDFSNVWSMAESMFREAVIMSDSTEPIHNGSCSVDFSRDAEGRPVAGLGESGENYFRDHPDELYVATIKAIDANWPGVFTKARTRIKDLIARFGKKKASKEQAQSNGQ